MTLPRTVAEVLREHITLSLEGIDRMYLNVYVKELQNPGGVAWFFREHRGMKFASSALMSPMTERFIDSIERYAKQNNLRLVQFRAGERKDELTQDYLRAFTADEGVLYVGKAQEKARVVRTERRRNPTTGAPYPWLVNSTAMVNQYYFYCVDDDFGPFFLKFCSYFPYNAKLCINGHEYLKRQLTKKGIAFEALDNGVLSCADPAAAQKICDELSAEKIDRLLRKWLRRLPHPFTPADRKAGMLYQLSILQAEFSLTQVLDRPVTGRIFFEEVIRENLDIGRPGQVQLIFDRRLTRRTPGTFRTRVITDGVVPSLHVEYKRTRIKQYHKEGRALRTETTINDTYDFDIGRRIKNLPALRQIGFAANRRLLDVQRVSHDCAIGENAFLEMQHPIEVNDQRVASLRFGDPRVQALLSSIVLFLFLPKGFQNRDLRLRLASLLGVDYDELTPGRMSYELRRLRLRGFIERIPRSHRYRVTEAGLRIALFVTRTYARVLRPGMAIINPSVPADAGGGLRRAFDATAEAVDRWCRDAKLAA